MKGQNRVRSLDLLAQYQLQTSYCYVLFVTEFLSGRGIGLSLLAAVSWLPVKSSGHIERRAVVDCRLIRGSIG